MRDLAIAADVSTATLYNLYHSKDELILAAVQELLRDISVSIEHQRTGLDHLLAREVAANAWASILMWMKGFIALHDFKDEHIGGLSAMLLPWLETSLEKQFREKTGLIR